MNGIGVILIVAGIIVAVALYQDGWEGIKSNPAQSTIDSSKTIFDAGKKVVGVTTDAYDNIKSKSESTTESSEEKIWTKIGQPFCSQDSDCTTLEECTNNNPCQCRENGYCYQ